MERQETLQVKVGVGIESMWEFMVNDLSSSLPKIMPEHVSEGEAIGGSGGLGTIYIFKFGPGTPNMRCQKEEVVELDESLHRIGLQVIEGGRLSVGFSYYKNTFQFTAAGNCETVIDMTVDYATESREKEVPQGQLLKSTLTFVDALVTYLLKKQAESK